MVNDHYDRLAGGNADLGKLQHTACFGPLFFWSGTVGTQKCGTIWVETKAKRSTKEIKEQSVSCPLSSS